MAISLLGVFCEFVIVANIGSNKYQYTAARSSSKHVAADSITYSQLAADNSRLTHYYKGFHG